MIRIMQEHVHDYAAGKKVFDEGEPLRAKHGCTGHEVFRSDEDGNELTLHLHFPSREAGETLRADPELAATMKRAGVESRPTVAWARDGDARTYASGRVA